MKYLKLFNPTHPTTLSVEYELNKILSIVHEPVNFDGIVETGMIIKFIDGSTATFDPRNWIMYMTATHL